MIQINKTNFRIKRLVDETDYSVRHLTMVVIGDVRVFDNQMVDCCIVRDDNKEDNFRGTILLPHYCESNRTTMFLISVEEDWYETKKLLNGWNN